ncbi:hypothetical protein EUX98_g7954 [Antrodiella citrinella]|uniref:Ubiquitin 3 binding protein But2 C-terminal domain-containing protein n=1 Tax=Antrodiella citrinella TaxID=2447956 RepID=A0A4S4MEB3_9APHY|nr:hypothetical protein EUX98_g7954 [Antrodiella citrinella]
MSFLLSLLKRPQHYDRLSSDSNGDSDLKSSSDDDLHEKHVPTGAKETPSNMVFYLTLVCVVCTLANLLVLRITEFKEANPPSLKHLRRPSQFPGLDKIERPVPPIERSIVNFPFVVARIDKQNPKTVVPENAPNGVANGNRVKVTSAISTVLQFRALDWGMESCELTVRLPGEEMVVDNSRSESTASLVLGPTHNHIYVHAVIPATNGSSSDDAFNPTTLTYASRPELGEKIGSLHLDYGFEWTHTFPCAMDSLHAFVLTAADDSTHVEWWQDRQSVLPAVYVEQHATK